MEQIKIEKLRQRRKLIVVEFATQHGDERAVEMCDGFRRMIYSLPEPYREALVLTEFDGLSQQQLAERLGISLSGAKSRVQRGRQQLKEMLHECCTFEFDRRGKVIDCTPRTKTKCAECG
jgi:RNA polymerase sigma-70 factor, ECF subfamily